MGPPLPGAHLTGSRVQQPRAYPCRVQPRLRRRWRLLVGPDRVGASWHSSLIVCMRVLCDAAHRVTVGLVPALHGCPSAVSERVCCGAFTCGLGKFIVTTIQVHCAHVLRLRALGSGRLPTRLLLFDLCTVYGHTVI